MWKRRTRVFLNVRYASFLLSHRIEFGLLILKTSESFVFNVSLIDNRFKVHITFLFEFVASETSQGI